MTPQELEIIKESQQYARVKKGKEKVIACPFIECFVYGVARYPVCVICHKWMETCLSRMNHPCDVLDEREVLKRYWRSTIHDTER